MSHEDFAKEVVRLAKLRGIPAEILFAGAAVTKSKPEKVCDLDRDEIAEWAELCARKEAAAKEVMELDAKLHILHDKFWNSVKERHKIYLRGDLHHYKGAIYKGSSEFADHEDNEKP